MSTASQDNGRRKVIVAPVAVGDTGVSLLKIIPIWIASFVVHMAIGVLAFFLFMFISEVRAGSQADNGEQVVETTQVEEQQKELDLTNTDLGNDPDTPLNFNVERIEDVSVPGPVDATAEVGVQGAPEDAIRQSVPAPPGSGGGLGGAPNLADGLAVGGPGALAGGYVGGLYNMNMFAGRSGSTREKMLKEGGGNKISEAAVASGLEWLALHQAQDGRWSLHEFNRSAREKPFPAGRISTCNCEVGATNRNDIAATGFALLPFLAAGQTHKPSKESTKDYSKTVAAGLKYLISKQSKEGYFGGDMYAHGIATIAMCEAYGLTSDPMLKASAQRAVAYIEDAQDPAGGGWRYSRRTPGDTSVTGWQLMALKSGQMSGLSIKKSTLKLSDKFLDSVESSNKGGYAYVPANGQGETYTMTSVGLLCRQYSGVNPRNPGLLAGVQRLKQYPPGKTGNLYYEYYATQVMHHMGGESWDFWNLGPDGKGKGGIRDTLIAKQDRGATPKRSHQNGSWGGASGGGRIMSTSLSLLCLEVYYRHLPLYRRDLAVNKENK